MKVASAADSIWPRSAGPAGTAGAAGVGAGVTTFGGIVMPGRPRGGIWAVPSSTARNCSPFCGRWLGRIESIQETASRKRGETPGTIRFSIASASSWTARAVAGAGGAPNSR